MDTSDTEVETSAAPSNKPETPAQVSAPSNKPETPAQVSARRKAHVSEGLAKCKRSGWVDSVLLTLQFDGLDSVEDDDARSLIESVGYKRFEMNPPDLRLSPAELNALHFEAVRLRIVKAAK